MSFKDDLARARAEREAATTLIDVSIGDSLYAVEARRLDGMQWAEIMAESPPNDEASGRMGFDVYKAGVIASRRYGRLLNAEGEAQDMEIKRDKDGAIIDDPWGDIFGTLSGGEVTAVGATWWALNMAEPNKKVEKLKKALQASVATS